MGDCPDWLATGPDVQSRIRAWAAERALRYDVAGLLPPASDHLRHEPRDLGTGARTVAGLDALAAEAARLAGGAP